MNAIQPLEEQLDMLIDILTWFGTAPGITVQEFADSMNGPEPERMYVVTTLGGDRLAAFPSRAEADGWIEAEEMHFAQSADWLYIESLPEDEDLYYSINS
jgi:hypothetical protein